MDSKEREAPQSFRPINKRPWEAETTRENTAWNGGRLPPIETVPYKRPHIITDLPDSFEVGRAYSPYGRPNSRDSTFNKASFEGSGHGDLSFWTKEKVPPLNEKCILSPHKTPVFNLTYSASRLPALPYEQSPKSKNTFVITESANSQDTSYLCRRCKKDLQDEEMRLFDSCQSCSQNPDLAYLTQATAAGLTHLAETLQTGRSTDQPFTTPAHGKVHSSSSDCPPIADSGLNASLSWILGKIYEVNRLADKLIQHVPREAQESLGKNYFAEELAARDGIDKMKRRWAPDSENASRKGGDDFDPASTDQRQRSSIASISVSDELPPMRTQSPYQPGGSTMHPPPAPSRQLPSPPGRQLPSPTSLNFPSPGASYSSQSTNIPSGVHQPTSSNLLPSISGLSGETATAVQAHSAALQHEVSVQKIALSSLQGEHDKLLAAFSRSQTRASALEKKHAVSDNEIINLTEEKIRLQQQVTELERDIEEVSRSRDTFREAAVQESSQYVEIVQRASRLEEMALGERKAWNALKAKMEQEIGLLRSGRDTGESSRNEIHGSVAQTAQATPPSPNQGRMKVDGDMNERSPDDPTVNTEEMREEIQRLKSRCIRAEETLRAVRADTVRIVGLFSTAGKDILERVDDVLQDDELQSRPDE